LAPIKYQVGLLLLPTVGSSTYTTFLATWLYSTCSSTTTCSAYCTHNHDRAATQMARFIHCTDYEC